MRGRRTSASRPHARTLRLTLPSCPASPYLSAQPPTQAFAARQPPTRVGHHALPHQPCALLSTHAAPPRDFAGSAEATPRLPPPSRLRSSSQSLSSPIRSRSPQQPPLVEAPPLGPHPPPCALLKAPTTMGPCTSLTPGCLKLLIQSFACVTRTNPNRFRLSLGASNFLCDRFHCMAMEERMEITRPLQTFPPSFLCGHVNWPCLHLQIRQLLGQGLVAPKLQKRKRLCLKAWLIETSSGLTFCSIQRFLF